MSDEAPLGDGSFRSTVIGGAPRVWQRILVSKHADASDRLSLSQTCSAARSVVLQHSPRLKIRLDPEGLSHNNPAAMHRCLRCLGQALRLRGQAGASLRISDHLRWRQACDERRAGESPGSHRHDPEPLLQTFRDLAEDGQHLHTLYLPCYNLSAEVLTAAARALPRLKRLSVSSPGLGFTHGMFEHILHEACRGKGRQSSSYGKLTLPHPSQLPQLLDLAVCEDLHSHNGELKVTGLPPYLQQLDSLALYDRLPHNPALTVLTQPATLLRRLRIHRLTDDWVKVLLQHAPVLEYVTAEELGLERSHAAARCNWERVTLHAQQDASDYIKLPRRRAGRLAVHMDEEARWRFSHEHPPTGVLLLSVSNAPAAPNTLLQRLQQDLTTTGYNTVSLIPSRTLMQRPTAQQAAAIPRYLPLLAALLQSGYCLHFRFWQLTPDVMRALLQAMLHTQPQHVRFKDCGDPWPMPARTLAQLATVPTTHLSIPALSEPWLDIMQRVMPQLQRVSADIIDLPLPNTIYHYADWHWSHLTITECLEYPYDILKLPLLTGGRKLALDCVKSVNCHPMVRDISEDLAEALERVAVSVGGLIMLTCPDDLMDPQRIEEQPDILRATLRAMRRLPWPGDGVALAGWSLCSSAAISALAELPQWQHGPSIIQRQPHKEPRRPEGDEGDAEFDHGDMTDKMMYHLNGDAWDMAPLPLLSSGLAHTTLCLQGVTLPQDPALCSQLLQSLPGCYTTWRIVTSGVTEEVVTALCAAAVTHRSAEWPLVVELLSFEGLTEWVDAVKERVQQLGGQGYITVCTRVKQARKDDE